MPDLEEQLPIVSVKDNERLLKQIFFGDLQSRSLFEFRNLILFFGNSPFTSLHAWEKVSLLTAADCDNSDIFGKKVSFFAHHPLTQISVRSELIVLPSTKAKKLINL